jgi:hypothetical protein
MEGMGQEYTLFLGATMGKAGDKNQDPGQG